jgi:hypothetical protein
VKITADSFVSPKMKKLLGASVILLTLLYVACVGWLHAHHLLFYRRIALEEPVRLEQGFSLRRQFTVDVRTLHWVAIQYDEVFRSTAEFPTPRDEFTAEFEVASNDKLIAKGGTASAGDWSGGGPAPWRISRDHVIRYLDSFQAEPGKLYQVSLRVTSAQSRLVSKKSYALIEVDGLFDTRYPVRTALLSAIGVVIGIAIFVCAWSMLRARRRANAPLDRDDQEAGIA